ncbi:hypothetical protein P7B02_01660 [Caulobacter segnis]|uniref:hypothetical protein n=1 Tax=Caulobacter segnis TaxID=88688 RepID=UPI0024108891|nr:hypothetical protein [Caulobacter segnis]MDG2520231.1 hypothetical protein [Caulobacter segnis]
MSRLWVLASCAFALLGGCRQETAIERLSRDADAQNPPRLWSVAVMKNGEEAAKVTLCASAEMKEGFERMVPMHEGKACALNDQPEFLPNRVKIRCIADNRPMLVENFTAGDRDKDFSVYMRMRSLDGGEIVREQTRRYRLIGDCPEGWRAGWSSDRKGRVVPAS